MGGSLMMRYEQQWCLLSFCEFCSYLLSLLYWVIDYAPQWQPCPFPPQHTWYICQRLAGFGAASVIFSFPMVYGEFGFISFGFCFMVRSGCCLVDVCYVRVPWVFFSDFLMW